MELGVARQEWFWAFEPRSSVDIVDALERAAIEPAPDLAVILLGSSRVRDAVASRVMEAQLELPAGSALNLGLTGGTPFDARTLYERNRSKLATAEVAVVGVEVGNFGTTPVPNQRVRRYATLEERMTWPGASKISLVIGYFWRTYDAREVIRCNIKSLLTGRAPGIPITEDGRISWRDPDEEGLAAIDVPDIVDRFEGREPGPGYQDDLQQLVDLLIEDGTQVLLVHIPTRDSFAEVLETQYPEWLSNFESALLDVSGPLVVDIHYRASDIPGLKPTDYYDYGHLTGGGAEVSTEYYAALIEAHTSGLAGSD